MEQRDGPAGSSKPLGPSLGDAETELVEADASDGAAPGSIFGAVALITGSSVGAGTLALPVITAPTVRLSPHLPNA